MFWGFPPCNPPPPAPPHWPEVKKSTIVFCKYNQPLKGGSNLCFRVAGGFPFTDGSNPQTIQAKPHVNLVAVDPSEEEQHEKMVQLLVGPMENPT